MRDILVLFKHCEEDFVQVFFVMFVEVIVKLKVGGFLKF